MNSSNGNFLDENGNPVNIVQLLKTGKAVPVENPGPGLHMAAHSGWFTDENGTHVNIIALIDAAIDKEGESDEPAIGGISVNGGNVVTPDENGIINLTISGDGSTVIDSELSASSTNPVQNKVVTEEINELSEAVDSLNGSLGNLGERITDLLTTADVSGVSITIRKEIRNSDGAVITNAKTAIITKYSTRYRAIEMTGDTYQQKVVLYNQSNQYDGLLSDYTNDLVSIPKSALYFRCTFKRKDGADMTSADIQSIHDAMVWYKQTDDSLSVPNIPADSSATGIRFTNVENRVSALEAITIPTDVKQALLRLLKKATYTSADMSADIRTVQDWVRIQIHYIDVSIKGNAPSTSDGSKKITSTLAYDNGLSAVFEVGASIYKVTDTGTHDRFRFYGISADLDVNDPSDFAQITVDRIADATTVSGLDSMSEYTVDNTVTQYKIIFVYLRDDTTDYNPNLVVEEVAE